MGKMYKFSDFIQFDMDTLVQIKLLHDISFEELIVDIVIYEDKARKEKDSSYPGLTEAEIKKGFDDMTDYFNEVTDNGAKVEELKELYVQDLFAEYNRREANKEPYKEVSVKYI